ncbi:MAG: hypothetical protein S4CHLAM2_04750 [Chlamydiales bacterium]|nr:hypothetical protein [Chlamydiales bacterium]
MAISVAKEASTLIARDQTHLNAHMVQSLEDELWSSSGKQASEKHLL